MLGKINFQGRYDRQYLSDVQNLTAQHCATNEKHPQEIDE